VYRWGVGSPSKDVLMQPADDVETLLKVRAWEVKDSPLDLGYREVENWPKLPSGWKLGPVAGVAADSGGRYYVYHRGEEAPHLLCFNRSGRLLQSWRVPPNDVGVPPPWSTTRVRPHGAKCDVNGDVWLTDDSAQVVYQYSSEGDLLRTLGTVGVSGEDETHFAGPTDVAFGLGETLYVSDGYGNYRVARFDKNLNFLGQWGSEGEGKGQFFLPHSVTTDTSGLVYVADRTNWRIQVFDSEGKYLRQWTHIGFPCGVFYAADGYFYVSDCHNGRVVKVDRSGTVLGFFEALPGHAIAVAPNYDILIATLTERVQLFTLE